MMEGHHLILGETTDFITGKTLKNTHDEEYRQKIARLLVHRLEYDKTDIKPRVPVNIKAGDKSAVVMLDFAVILSHHVCMIIKYGPGSLVTRHRPGLAISRLLAPYQVPVVVVTNGEEADILNGDTGEEMGSGFDALPSKPNLLKTIERHSLKTISEKQREMEARILYAFEIDGSCPCDDTNADCGIWSHIDTVHGASK